VSQASADAAKIYRKVALDRMSSPEQLDALLRVTRPRTWLALLALIAVLAAALAWGYFGEITRRVSGQGVLIRSGGVRNVVPLGAGQVLEINVRVGDPVAVGQVIGTVAQPALVEQIRVARSRLAETMKQRSAMVRMRADRGRLQIEALKRERANIESEITGLQAEITSLREEKLPVDEELLRKGLITKSQVGDTKARIENAQSTIAARRARLAQLDASEFETGTANIEANIGLQNRVVELEREVTVLEAQLQSESRVVSPYAGQVLEIRVSPGGLVSVGTPIISLQPDVRTLEAVLYVPAEQAKELRPGMDAEILPTTVRREEYGFIRGTVTFVSDYPATEAATMRVFENAPLVQALSSRGPVTEVRVEMAVDAATPSGYKWSSARGAPLTLSGGTLCIGDVVTRRQKPITLIVPELKTALGVS
jgi:HlyD family secretion protein